MSAGCVHQKASVALASGFVLGSLVFGPGIEYALGALAGIFISPDLDVDNGNIADTIIRNRLGLPAEKVWDGFWYAYRRSLKHGGPLSHIPVIGTIGRLGYVYLFALVVPYVILSVALPGAWTVGDELAWWNDQIVQRYQLILGLMGSDLIHWALDIATTEDTKSPSKTACRPIRLPSFSAIKQIQTLVRK